MPTGVLLFYVDSSVRSLLYPGTICAVFPVHAADGDIFLHRDKTFMPQNPAAWSAWNFLGTVDNKNLGESGLPYLVTLNPPHTPDYTLLKWSTGHPVPSVAASKASTQLNQIQGKRGIWFCGTYQGIVIPRPWFARHRLQSTGFEPGSLAFCPHKEYASYQLGCSSIGERRTPCEDKRPRTQVRIPSTAVGAGQIMVLAGLVAAKGLLRKRCIVLDNPKHMVPSWTEAAARILVTRFVSGFIATGCLILLEEGGTMFTFEGTAKKSFLKVSVKVHSPQFYRKDEKKMKKMEDEKNH
ncbi:hypothetical protein ACH5RR_031559 [Cinchona calisaya]|uniref:Uncharacterized protein n=1 Tax=Cinchona calisaya TaxID=153742 RepID=A0ABD2YK11_9GENT